MSHLHGLVDDDVEFIIDPETRTIIPPNIDMKLVQYDHNSEVYTFHLPRYIDGHDMSLCNRVEVHYINIGRGGQQSANVYEVTDFSLTEDETAVIARWTISGNATKYAGTLSFVVRFACLSESEIVYAWNTEKYSGITVGEGINNGEEVMEEYTDILAEWEQRVLDAASGSTLPSGGTEGQILTKTATGAEWADLPEADATGDTVYVNLDSPDKTVDELLEAYNNGMSLLGRILNDTVIYQLYSVDTSAKQFVFYCPYAFAGEGITLSLKSLTASGVETIEVAISEGDKLPTGGTDGQFLTLTDGSLAWANLPEQETELPTGGAAGQVLTIGSDGFPVWADPTTLTSVYEGVF